MGALPPEQMQLFYNNPRFSGLKFPSVQNPQTLEKRYQGILSGVLIDFMRRTLELDPCDRATIAECLHHEAFRTEHLLSRQNKKAVPRKNSDTDSDTRRNDDDDSDDADASQQTQNSNHHSVQKHQVQPQKVVLERNDPPEPQEEPVSNNKFLKSNTKNYSRSDNEQHRNHQHQDVQVKLVKHQNHDAKNHGSHGNDQHHSELPRTHGHTNANNNRQAYGSTFTDFRNMSIKESNKAYAKPVSQMNGSHNHNEDLPSDHDSSLARNNSQRFLKKNKQLKVESPKELGEGTVGTPRPHIDVPGKDNSLSGKNSTYTVSFNAGGQQQQGSNHDSPQADRKSKYGSHQEELQKIRSSMRRKNREGSAPTRNFAERLAERPSQHQHNPADNPNNKYKEKNYNPSKYGRDRRTRSHYYDLFSGANQQQSPYMSRKQYSRISNPGNERSRSPDSLGQGTSSTAWQHPSGAAVYKKKKKKRHNMGLGHTDNTSLGHTRGVPPKPQQHVKDWDVMSAQDWDHSGGGLYDDANRDHPNSRTPQPYRKYTPIDKRQLQPLPNHSKQLNLRGATRGSSTTPTALYPPPAATATTIPGDTSSLAGSPRGGAKHFHNAHSKSDHDHNVFTSKSRSERHASGGGVGGQYSSEGAQLDRSKWAVGGPGTGAKRSAVHIPTMDFRALRESNL